MLYQSTSSKTLNPVSNKSIQSICIKNNRLESVNVNNRRDDVIQILKVLGELTLMSIGLIDIRKYDGF